MIKSTRMPTTTVTGIEICRLFVYQLLAVSSALPLLHSPFSHRPP